MTAPLSDLLRHAARMSDFEISHDLDCLVAAAETPEAAETLTRYAKARKEAPYFGPGKKGANNHASVKGWKKGR